MAMEPLAGRAMRGFVRRSDPPRRRRSAGAILALGRALGWAMALVFSGGGAWAAPPRILSLNPCLDAILVQVADRNQIVALSRYSRVPSESTIAPLAQTMPFTWGGGEEILAMHPDLVLVSGMGGAGVATLLPRLHIASAHFTVPATIDESLAQVLEVARRVGHPDRGRALVARIRAALDAAAPRPGERPLTALVYERQGFASGPHTLMDALMRRTGFRNAATSYGMRRSGRVPLETLIAHPPEVLLAGQLAPDEPTWADRLLSHPALRAIAPYMRRASFPAPLLYCGGPVLIPAAQALARIREEVLRQSPLTAHPLTSRPS
jgi:iron complex transport system substrate-binding protein